MIIARFGTALFALGILLGGSPSGAGAGPRDGAEDSLTVAEAVRQALSENPTIQASRQHRRATSASVREARSEWFPVVEGQAQYRRTSDNGGYTVMLPSASGSRTTTFAPAILNRYSARARLEQPLFTGFRVPNQLDAAQAQAKAAEARTAATTHTVAYRTRVAYWRLYEAKAREAATADALRQIKRQLTDVRNRADAGRATEADVLRVKARRDQVRVEHLQAENDVRSARRTLNERMGRALDASVVIADTVVVDSVEREASQLMNRAREQRPDLDALRQTVDAREAEVDVAQAGWYPTVSLIGSSLYARPNEQIFPPADRFQQTWQVGVTLSWSLSLGGRTDATTDRAQARRLQAKYELQDRRWAVAVEVRKQRRAVEQARAAVAAAATSVQSAREAYRATQSRYEEGLAVVSDVLDAEQALRKARSRLASAQADYALAWAGLRRALGASPLGPVFE